MFRIYRSLADAGPEARPSALAIGNFDGVHVGHRKILRRVAAFARENGQRPSILTFEPHPTRVVAPDRAPKLLSTLQQRLDLAQEEGIGQAFVLPFDAAFSRLSPEEFVRNVMVDGAGAGSVFVGENFRFGFKQRGDVDLLKELGRHFGFCVEIVPSVVVRGRMVSSSEVRRALNEGAVSLACRLLDRPYWIEGRIVSGHGIGSKQTVPTLNLDTNAEVIPADGIYITRTTRLEDRQIWPSVTSIGMNPTFSGKGHSIETFLLSPFDGITPKRIRLEFLKRIREERKFDSAEALKTQIFRDVDRAQAYFRRRAGLKFK